MNNANIDVNLKEILNIFTSINSLVQLFSKENVAMMEINFSLSFNGWWLILNKMRSNSLELLRDWFYIFNCTHSSWQEKAEKFQLVMVIDILLLNAWIELNCILS